MNNCQFDHTTHDTKNVSSILGEMVVFDWEKYTGQDGYCTGQDDISMTLEKYGIWEPVETKVIANLLDNGAKGSVFIDIGCHIGWYSVMAAQKGFNVWALDGDGENLILAAQNIEKNCQNPIYSTQLEWFDTSTEVEEAWNDNVKSIYLVKIDIEGNEQYAVEKLSKLFERRAVKNLVMEVSPCFNDSYPALVERLEGWGYKPQFTDGRPFDYSFDFAQDNVLFTL